MNPIQGGAHGASFAITAKARVSAAKSLFVSPDPAGRQITAGFSYIQRIGKTASVDVWFPDCIKQAVDDVLAVGEIPGPDCFPAQWAAVRQFELLQEAGNLSIYNLAPENLTRALRDITSHMHGGGYRITIATIGSYSERGAGDELAILDRRIQDRISNLINMLYLEEQSEKISAALAESLRLEKWDYRQALPHVGVTLGARHLFRPHFSSAQKTVVRDEPCFIPSVSPRIAVEHAADWTDDLGVADALTGYKLARVDKAPTAGQYAVGAGTYRFAASDAGRNVLISYRYQTDAGAPGRAKLSETDRKHLLSRRFFEILNLLPQKHILHDTAVGLQLPEACKENHWVYIAPDGEKAGDFVRLMDNLFAPFNKISMSELDGRTGAGSEITPMVTHMRGYGDRLRADADHFYRNLARHAM